MDTLPHTGPLTSLPLLLVTGEGNEHEVRIKLDWPRPDGDEKGRWSCTLDLLGLGERPHQIYGGDGLQTLVLALRLAEVQLTLAARRLPGRWLDPETRDLVDLAGYFGHAVVAAAD